MGQSSLGDYSADDEDARPASEEAKAVAGNTSTNTHLDKADVLYEETEETVDIAVMQVDYTIEGSGDDEYPVIHVFGRTTDGELVHARVREFKPYFYTPVESVTEGRLEEYDRITAWEETDENGQPFQSIRGTELLKVYGQTPRDVGQIRDEFDHYEADILFPNRFLIDKDITSGIRIPRREIEGANDADRTTVRVHHEEVSPVEVDVTPRVNTFDIEVEDRHGFPEDGEEPIICIASHDSYDDEYILWLVDAQKGVTPPAELPEYEPIQTDSRRASDEVVELDYDIRIYESEAEMLAQFLDYLDETDPDVLTGWNFDDFDAPYLVDRLDVLDSSATQDLDSNRLSRVNEVWDSGWGGPDIKGRVVFDLLYAYQRTQFSELESYRLEAVGQRELGVGKERYTGDIGDMWEDNPERLLEYNLRDVELCVELDREQDIIAFWNEVRQFVGCKLEDATTPGDAVDMYVLHKLHDKFALPSKGQQESEEYEGGAVFDPISGVRKNVSVLDLKCFSGDTNVLTPEGEKNIRDVEIGDPVYTLNPDTFECEIKPVVETHEYDNRFDELHHLSGNTHNFKITENHRFLTSSKRGWDEQTPEDFEFTEYRNIPPAERFAFPQHNMMAGRLPNTYQFIEDVNEGYVVVYTDTDLRQFRNRMPKAVTETLILIHGTSKTLNKSQKVGKYLIPVETYRQYSEIIDKHADDLYLKYNKQHRETPFSFEMTDWLELIGWYVTEGSSDRAADRLTIHQSDPETRKAICHLLDGMGLNYNTDSRGVNISNRYLLEWFERHCGDGYATKHLPEWVFELDGELLSLLVDTMIRGDGSYTESGLGKFWTKSHSLKKDFVRIAVRSGHKPTVSKQSDDTWYISVGKKGSFKKASNASVEPHDGTVYCITAKDNHVVLAGRNGQYQWIGQSLYPMCMVTINASPETKVDADSYGDETYRAPNGTHFQQEPDGAIRGMVDELLTEREQKKELRNQHDPKSAEYEQYDRQQAAVKVIMNCFTPDTEVLTPDGVRLITDLEIGDEVYSLDPGTMNLQVKEVTDTHAYPDYRGELVDIQTSKIDFRVTPNHRMLVRQNDTNGITQDSWDFIEAGDLNESSHYELPHDWDFEHGSRIETVDLTEYIDAEYEVWVRPSVHGHTFTTELGWTPPRVQKNDIGQVGYVFTAAEFEQHREYIESVCERSYIHAEPNRKWIPRVYDGDEFIEFLAWYITEGNVYTTTEKQFGNNYRGCSTTVKIAQSADSTDKEGTTATQSLDVLPDGGDNHHLRIGKLLDSMGFDCYTDDRSFSFTSELLGNFLKESCGDGSFEKRIPECIFQASREQKQLFLETLIDGDGDRQPNSWRFSTASQTLRDDVIRLCAQLGKTVTYNHDSGSWRVYCTEGGKNSFRMHRSGSRSTADEGVYCVTVEDNHTLMAGRNGTFQHVGQSLYGVLGWTRFRLYDREMGAAVTATGREVIEFTEEVTNELDKEVIYGDTDSVMISVGNEVSQDEAIDRSLEIEERINDSYDEFALEELNATEHRFQIEFEKLYRRFFQAGKKKRYAGHIVWKEGQDVDDIDITGFEYQRSDIAAITKEVQKNVIEMIVTGDDFEYIKTYVTEVIEEFKEGNADPERIGIPGGIGKRLDNYDTDTAQVRGAKYANLLLGTNFQRGSKPKRLYLKRVHSDFFERIEAEQGLDPSTDPLYGEFKRNPDVICIEYADQLPEEFEIDWEKMLEKTLQGPIERILEALDITWQEVKSGQEQKGLGEYM